MDLLKPPLPAFSVFTATSLVDVIGSHREASTTFSGAALFVDMSNYTSLAETLCREGSDGRERLSQILNQIFSQHVDCIYRAGGEIASFMGDGVLAFWPARTTSASDALASADQCATELHQAQTKLASTSDIFPDLHIGVAAGELWAARLGGVDHVWHQILAGQAAREAFNAGNRAKPGETIVVQGERLEGQQKEKPPGLEEQQAIFVQDHPDHLHDDQKHGASGFVPRVIRDWWSDERRRWLPQVRMITALFVKIDGLPAEHDDNLPAYQRSITALQRAIRPYSASSGTLIVDDKGLVFKLYFGMPYNSHRNDDAQALQAALSIQSALNAMNLSVSIGIADGEGICMPIGGHERMEYTTIGRFSHLAARLMDATGKAVLCTSDVAAKADRDAELTECPPMSLKGVDAPVAVFSAEAMRPSSKERHPLIGRDAEIALIEDRLNRLRSGEGGVLYIVGDAGIGKTALINHLIDMTSSGNLATLIGGSSMREVVQPFHSWRPVFSQLLDVGVYDDPSDVRTTKAKEKLRGLPKEAQQLLPLINAVFPDMTDANADVEKLSGEARVDATLSFLISLIRYLAPPGFILILEDCHWMDSASWRLLERLTATSHNMLIVLSSRPQPKEVGLEAIRARPDFKELLLKPLSGHAIKQIIQSSTTLDVSDEQDQTLLDQAADFASGNPLYAKEFAYLITSEKKAPLPSMTSTKRKASSKAERGSRKSRIGSSWPMTLQGLIANRLDSLKPPELLTLKAASVIGSQFDLPLLGHIVPDRPQPNKLLLTITDLLSRHLVLAIDRAANIYRFQHDLIREVVYGQLTRDQRQLLHNRAAEAIETIHHENLAGQFAALADHWSKADEGSKALTYAELAAEQAIRSGGYEEAQRLLGLCFNYADQYQDHRVEAARRLRWYRLSADTHSCLGNLAERSKDADAALRIAGMRRVRSRPRMVMNAISGLTAWGGRRLLGGFGSAPTPGRSELSQELARIYRHHAAIAWFSSDPIAMSAHSVAALHHAETGSASDVLAGASVEFGGILGLLGFRSFGRSLMQRALAIAEEVDHQSMLAYVRLLTCLYEVGIGNWSVADHQALACEQLANKIGDRINWSNVQAVRFWTAYYQNDLETAQNLAERFRTRQEVDGNDQHHAWALRFTALSALRQQQPKVAVQYLEQASAYLTGSTAANETLPAVGLLALARYRCGDRTRAFQSALDGFSMIDEVGRPTGHAMLEGYAALTEVSFHALLQEPGSATWQSAFSQCLNGLNRFQRVFPIGKPRYRIWRGLEQALRGHGKASRTQFTSAKASADHLGMPWERELAAMALAVGPEQFLQDIRDQSS